MSRKLVTLRKVAEIHPIEGADLIQLARVDGWQCVIKKGEFQAGDLGAYFEIDSYLPIRPEFEFLRKSSYKKLPDGREGFRLRTVKLRGCLSQGLLLPPASLALDPAAFDPEADLAEALGVVLYEPPIPASLSGEVKGLFPSFVPKTDEERIQNLSEYFEQYGELDFEATMKLDGSSMTVYFNNGEFGVCSRNLELRETPRSLHWQLARRGGLQEKLAALGRNLALQGEVMGEGIQGNKERLKGQDFFLFNIYDIDRLAYLLPRERRELAAELGVRHVPLIDPAVRILHPEVCRGIDGVLEYAQGESLNGPVREGVVFKSNAYTGQFREIVHFKAINNGFLLKYDD